MLLRMLSLIIHLPLLASMICMDREVQLRAPGSRRPCGESSVAAAGRPPERHEHPGPHVVGAARTSSLALLA